MSRREAAESEPAISTSQKVPRERKDRRIAILEASKRTLIEDGYADFSLRKVARRAGVHLKTLQHYFETKATLVAETVQFISDEAAQNYQARASALQAELSDLAIFQTTILMMIEDCEDEGNCRAFYELWALAARDQAANHAVDSMYARHRYALEVLISRVNPRLSRATVSLRAALVAAQISGLAQYVGRHQPRHYELEGLKEEAVRALTELILSKE